MNRKQRKIKALKDFTDKWNLSNYRFFVRSNRTKVREEAVHIVKKDLASNFTRPQYNEIHSIISLIKNFAIKEVIIYVYEGNNPQTFSSLEELKHHFLIRKIAGV